MTDYAAPAGRATRPAHTPAELRYLELRQRMVDTEQNASEQTREFIAAFNARHSVKP